MIPSQYQVRNDTDDNDHKADDLRLLKWTDHQAVCPECLHKEPFHGIENSIEKQHLPLKLPVIVNKDQYQEKNETPDGFVEESGVIGLSVDDHRPWEICRSAVSFPVEVVAPAAD